MNIAETYTYTKRKLVHETSKNVRRYVWTLIYISFCMGIFFLFPVHVSAKEQETVKVGYYFSHNFQEGADDTSPKSGYSYEYLQKIASYTGWKYEYVYGEWNVLFEQLKNGEIDLMAGIAYSEDRTEQINYPDSEMLNETFYIYKAENDSSIQCGNINSYNGKKIGVLKNNQRMVSVLEKWKSKYHANIECVSYTDMLECSNAFNKKEIDAFVSADNVVSYYSGITPVEKIGKQPFYLCVAKDRTDLLSDLNMAVYKKEAAPYPSDFFAGKRILLAENNRMNREIAVAILEDAGLKVDVAENGKIAVDKISYYPPGFYTAVLMDIQMPVMDGYTATREIRALPNPSISKIPIIAVSANAFDEDREASRRAGMNGHLAKPIVVSDLLEILANIIFTEDKKIPSTLKRG